ncbi:MAG: hypothetical protein JSR78_07230 [Proteobacteria bacterium]|nr:hypothetical protein [Pseudomonadota bacterium]
MSRAIRKRLWLSIAREAGREVAECATLASTPNDIISAVLDRAAERLLREMSGAGCHQDEIQAALIMMNDTYECRSRALRLAFSHEGGHA